MFCFCHRIVAERDDKRQTDQSDPACTNQESSHHRLCFDLDRSKESGHAAQVVCEACVRVARCVTRDDMGVSSHRCWARFGWEGGNPSERGKMKGKNYFEKPWFCDVDVVHISDYRAALRADLKVPAVRVCVRVCVHMCVGTSMFHCR